MRKTVFIMALLLIAFSMGWAQGYKGQGRASGLVTDEEGRPLEGVIVRLFSVKGQSGFETKTDGQGEWKALYIRGGGWNIDFEKDGYIPKKISVELKESNRNKPIEISLIKVEGLLITEELKKGIETGNNLFNEMKYEEAARVFETLVADDPNAYILNKNIGNCYFELQKYDLAEQYYLKVLDKEPDNAEIMMLIGNTYSNRCDQAKAMEWYGKIDIEKITDVTALFNIANSLFSQANYEEALKYCRRALEIEPDSTDILYLTGLIDLNTGNKPEAVSAFERYLKLDAESDRAGQVRNFLEFLKKSTRSRS